MGGRGKAGGIKFADDAQQGETLAKELIGKHFVIDSESRRRDSEVAAGRRESRTSRARRTSRSRSIATRSKPVFIVQRQGRDGRRRGCRARSGRDRQILGRSGDRLLAVYRARAGFSRRSFPSGTAKRFRRSCGGLYQLFMDYGANLLEINPLVLTKDGTRDRVRRQSRARRQRALQAPRRSSVEQNDAVGRRPGSRGRDRPGMFNYKKCRRTGRAAEERRHDRERRGPRHGDDGRGQERRRRRRELPRHRRRRAS